MHFQSEIALNDCKRAFELLDDIDCDEQLFRIQWLAILTLLSTIGDVLKNIDCLRDSRLKSMCKRRYKELKDNAEVNKIYWEFIKKERNIIVHEYKSNFDEEDTALCIDGRGIYILPPTEQILPSETYSLSTDIYRPMKDKERWGVTDCRDIMKEAIDWWENEINYYKINL